MSTHYILTVFLRHGVFKQTQMYYRLGTDGLALAAH